MAILESQLSQQVVGSLAADILAPLPPVLGLIQALSVVDGPTPKGKTRITLNWAAPIRNEIIGGELLKLPDDSPSLAQGVGGAIHEAQFDPIEAGSYSVFERTGISGAQTTLSASTLHGQRKVNVQTPVPGDIAADAWVVIDPGIAGKEEYLQVKSVNAGTGEVVFKNGLFFDHASGAAVQQATLTSKTEGTHYDLDKPTGVLTEQAGGFTAGNRIVMLYQTTVQDLGHYELYRVPGNAPVAVPTKANVLAAAGVQTVDAAILATATSKQDATLTDAEDGKDFTYYLFAVDTAGNASNLTSEVMTANTHLVFIETVPTVPQGLATQVSSNKVLVTWQAVTDPNANGYNVFRSDGSSFDPNAAVKLNSSLVAKGSGTATFDDSAGNSANRRPPGEVPYPVDGQTYSYKVETEDSTTFWTNGTSNLPPPADMDASKNAGAGDGTGGR
ncbi:MAG: hypothetical protein WC728_03805 [Elusimicrobiota bacterium]